MLKTTTKVEFNPESKKHRDIYKEFLKTGKWPVGGCPFKAEFPHLSVPATIDSKLVRKYLKIEQELCVV